MANTYGNSGNRWWVLYNTSQQDSTAVGTQVGDPFLGTPSGYQVEPSGNATDDAIFAGAPLGHGKTSGVPTVSVENVTWIVEEGPYTTSAAATTALSALQKSNPAPGDLQQVTGISPNDFADVGSALTAFYDAVTDGQMWRSLGWIGLGVLLLFVGLALLLRQQIEGAVGQVAKAVAIP